MKRRHKKLNKNNFLTLPCFNMIIRIKKIFIFLYVNMIYILHLPNEINFSYQTNKNDSQLIMIITNKNNGLYLKFI